MQNLATEMYWKGHLSLIQSIPRFSSISNQTVMELWPFLHISIVRFPMEIIMCFSSSDYVN